VSVDPNSSEALDHRQAALDSVEVLRPRDRIEFVADVVRDRRVLDVGCVDHFEGASSDPAFLHRVVASSARECLGLDIEEAGLEALAASGFEVACVDVTSRSDRARLAGRSFEVIVAGEVIEHLAQPEALFELGDELLTPDGTLVITTPNPYAPHRVSAGRRMAAWENVDHTTYHFPAGVIEMAGRHDLVLEACMTTGPRSWRYPSVLACKWFTWRVSRAMVRAKLRRDIHDLPLFDIVALMALGPTSRRLLGETTIYVFRRARSDVT
jgi:SAM-dependent methyltransferase